MAAAVTEKGNQISELSTYLIKKKNNTTTKWKHQLNSSVTKLRIESTLIIACASSFQKKVVVVQRAA